MADSSAMQTISAEFKDFLAPLLPRIAAEDLILANLFDVSRNSPREQQVQQLQTLVDEAEETLRMIAPFLRPGQALLEVGGGIALAYAFLQSRGFAVVSLEPSSGGFGNRYLAGQRLLELAGLDARNWQNRRIEDLNPAEGCFDLIFSNFVLEHIQDLDASFARMKQVLKPDGRMVHRCPNYSIPFENHYNIPLFPGFPRWTAFFRRRLKGDPLWEELHFTTRGEIRGICARQQLQVSFQPGMLGWAFRRVLANPTFQARKQGFAKLARGIEACGFMRLLDLLPSWLSTPMTFSVFHAPAGDGGERTV